MGVDFGYYLAKMSDKFAVINQLSLQCSRNMYVHKLFCW